MRDRSCIACGGPPPFDLHFERAGRRLVRCQCGMVFQDPQPSARELEESYYHDKEFADALLTDLRGVTVRSARRKLKLLPRVGARPMPGDRLLDVGASSGAWLETARELGAVATGVELGEATAEAARRRGLDMRTGTLAENESALAAEDFDLVTFWDVLEHLRDPRDDLAVARGLLRPGGRVAATFPNVEGLYPRLTHRLIARRYGVWEYPELPVHLYDFSPKTAAAVFRGSGFEVEAITTFATPYGFYRSTSLSKDRTGAGVRGRFIRAAFHVTMAAAYPVAWATDKGNSMFILARKP